MTSTYLNTEWEWYSYHDIIIGISIIIVAVDTVEYLNKLSSGIPQLSFQSL